MRRQCGKDWHPGGCERGRILGSFRDLRKGGDRDPAHVPNARLRPPRPSVKASADGFYLGPVFKAPIHENFDLVGRIGWYRSETPVTAAISFAGTINGSAVAANRSASKTFKNTDLYWGVGGTYKFNKNVGLGLEYSKYKLGGDVDTKLDVWSLRLTYRF